MASLVLLTPLVRELRRWHIDVRKTARPASTKDILQSQTSKPKSRYWQTFGFLVMFISVAGLMDLSLRHTTQPATLSDVALIGVMVVNYIVGITLSRDA